MPITPPYLQLGDTIALIATARKVSREEIKDGVSLLESWGFKVILGPNLFAEEGQFAGSAELRAEALQWAIEHKEVKAIWCARGGYGTVKLLPYLQLKALKENPKLICGFSDVTVLHAAAHQLGIASIHGTMPYSVPKNEAIALQSFKASLLGELQEHKALASMYNREGTAEGELIGGNLSILYALTGTELQMDTSGKILFIEDLDEYLYHIDRMMTNLKMAGMLANLAGLVVGGMSDMNDNRIGYGKTAYEIITEAVAEYAYPVCFDFPAGHIPGNRSMVFGVNHKLNVRVKGAELKQVS